MSNKKIENNKLRRVAGSFATGITVVTTEAENGEVHGMTANSFLSVSLDPALVSFSVKKNALLFRLLEIGKVVGISILGASQKNISNQFAGFNEKDIDIDFIKKEGGASIIGNSLAWYSTIIYQIIPTGDHYLILCEIIALDIVKEEKPLIYFSGYRTIGEKI